MILALDTSGEELLVVVFGEAGMAGCATRRGARHQGHVIAAIEEALDAAGIRVADVDRLAIVSGPGSHTGLRVGLSTIAGIAYARRLPIHPLSSLQVAAARATIPGPLVAVVNAGRGRVFALEGQSGGGAEAFAGEPSKLLLVDLARFSSAPLVGDPGVVAQAAAAGVVIAPQRHGCEALAVAAAAAVGGGRELAYDQLRGTYA